MTSAKSRSQRAFTLIELLVVVAIIALLLSILLPSLKCAKDQARATVCGTTLKNFGNAFQTYFSENQEWIPGVNTTGFAVRTVATNQAGLQNPRIPVQSFDWMSPILRSSIELPNSRAKRFRVLQNDFRCPSQGLNESILYPAGLTASPDRADFTSEPGVWTSISYLMPVHFQYWGQQDTGPSIGGQGPFGVAEQVVRAPTGWEVRVDKYKPRVGQVGSAANKVAVADGTRFLAGANDGFVLDHDVSPKPTFFGSFTSAGAFWCGDQAYGVKQGSQNWDGDSVNSGSGPDAEGRALELSYRHGCDRASGEQGVAQSNRGTMNALFFDGHVSRLSDRKSRDVQLWYPKGAIIQNPQEGMVRVPQNYEVP